jgi:uncharacterized protein (TIGR03546 family)
MFGLKFFSDLFKALSSGASPSALAAGLVLGFSISLIPGWPLHVLVLILIVIFFNVNIGMAVMGAALAGVLGLMLDPLLDNLGYAVLTMGALESLWTMFYNNELLMLTRFNNSIVMGATVLCLIGSLPAFFIGRVLVIKYRVTLDAKIKKLRITKILRGSRLFGMFRGTGEG